MTRTLTKTEYALTKQLATANAAISADDLAIAADWKAARTPFAAIAQRTSPEKRAYRASLFQSAQEAREGLQALRAGAFKKARVLNARGLPQATLAPAVLNNITIGPAKTLEERVVTSIRNAQIERPAKASKKVAKCA